MITPAILILGTGSLLGTVLSRLGRVVDQVRRVAATTPTTDAEIEKRKLLIHLMKCRARHAERSVTFYYNAVSLFILTCLLIAADKILGRGEYYWAPVATSVGGVLLMFIGTGSMVAECRLAVKQLHDEISEI